MALKVCFVLLSIAGYCAATQNRIIGGEPTTVERYPSIVQVEYYDPFGRTWYQSCAANILKSDVVLSAAHCFDGFLYTIDWRRIRAGTSFQSTRGQVSMLVKVLNHPNFGELGGDGDITLITLQTPLVYSSVVQQATIIAHGSEIPDNLPVVHAGWGYTIPDDVDSGAYQLRDVTIYTINHKLCHDRYQEEDLPVTENMICAGILDAGGKDACQGDSGGPLYFGNILIGIVSWGKDCADEHYPGVNTKIASYTNWILDNVQ